MTAIISTIESSEFSNVPASIQEKLESLLQNPWLDRAGLTALIKFAAQINAQKISENEILRILFNPTIPSSNDISEYRRRHTELYSARAPQIVQEITKSNQKFFCITSGMYAGKSTLAGEVCKGLEQSGIHVVRAVPHFMGKHITQRGKVPCENDKTGVDGFVTTDALPLDPNNLEEFFNQANIPSDKPSVIYLDEFSFLDPASLRAFISRVQADYPLVKFLLVGLNTNTFGKPLEGYEAALGYNPNLIQCNSFVPGEEVIEENGEKIPTGTMTIRYLRLPDGSMVLDTGFLPVVVPKEAGAALYAPANPKFHPLNVLAEERALVEIMINPVEESKRMRQECLQALTYWRQFLESSLLTQQET